MKPHHSSKQELSRNKQIFCISIVILFHLVGLVGLSMPSIRSQFLQIVPYHLLLMLAVITYSHIYMDGRFILFVLCIFILGFGAEWIGVHEHWLFGNYGYGHTLGLQLSGVPLIIGVNWFLLTYSSGVLLQRSHLKNMFLRAGASAFVLVLLDLLIEPVAAKFDYWHWVNAAAPLKNYVCWFFVSAFMLLIFDRLQFKKQSVVAHVFLVTQFAFFVFLYLSL
ncbi:MAG: carotenoid biosynthesis protein [Mucilaginibacter sp.]